MKARANGMARNAEKTALVAMIALVVILQSPRAIGDIPLHSISVDSRNGKVVFTFEQCGGEKPSAPVWLSDIFVYEEGRLDAVCKRSSISRKSIEVRRWEYGSALEGFRGGECEELKPGRRYAISSLGSGDHSSSGIRRFSFRGPDRVEARKGTCDTSRRMKSARPVPRP
jgi:hypothetical protein